MAIKKAQLTTSSTELLLNHHQLKGLDVTNYSMQYNAPLTGRSCVDDFVLLEHKMSDAAEVQAALAADG